ncbi:hypothetical protein P8452_33383 [Trifolium repens]|nr:hypothetical protein P8452_33383 [Trifolium repens]
MLRPQVHHIAFLKYCPLWAMFKPSWNNYYGNEKMLMSKLHLPTPYAPYNDTQMKGISSRKSFLFHENHNGACS